MRSVLPLAVERLLANDYQSGVAMERERVLQEGQRLSLGIQSQKLGTLGRLCPWALLTNSSRSPSKRKSCFKKQIDLFAWCFSQTGYYWNWRLLQSPFSWLSPLFFGGLFFLSRGQNPRFSLPFRKHKPVWFAPGPDEIFHYRSTISYWVQGVFIRCKQMLLLQTDVRGRICSFWRAESQFEFGLGTRREVQVQARYWTITLI